MTSAPQTQGGPALRWWTSLSVARKCGMLPEIPLVSKEMDMAKEARTMAMRVLDARKIHYLVHRFPETIRDAEQVAAEIGMPPSQVFKTLVLLRGMLRRPIR